MPKATSTDPRIDAYIAKSPAFAQPILAEVRSRVHRAWPGVEETIKWNAPFYLHQGKLLVSTAAFKNHAKVLVWLGTKPTSLDVTTVAELPAEAAFAKQVNEAVAFIERGADETLAAKKPAAKKPAGLAATAKKPSTKAAAGKTPAMKTPAVKTPAVKTPAVKTPAVKTPAVKTPAVKTPTVKKSSTKAAEGKKPATNRAAAKKKP